MCGKPTQQIKTQKLFTRISFSNQRPCYPASSSSLTIMNSTLNSDERNSGGIHGYAYYSIGLTLGVLLVIIIITITSYYCSRGRIRNTQVNATSNLELDSSLAIQVHHGEAILNNYPVLLYSQAKQHKLDPKTIAPLCSICLAEYKDIDWLQVLPDCAHMFHRDCIDRWLPQNRSCPVCRTSPLPNSSFNSSCRSCSLSNKT